MEKFYGVSSKLNLGAWEHVIYVFDNKEDSQKWLENEDHGFGERKLMSETDVIILAGKEAVSNAINYKEDKSYGDFY